MIARLFATPRKDPRDVLEEINALCHARQVEILTLPRDLHRDVGVDCGCFPEQKSGMLEKLF